MSRDLSISSGKSAKMLPNKVKVELMGKNFKLI
jgi:hypothetical protein